MGKLTLNEVEELLVNQFRQTTEIEELILNYAALREKLENIEEQSWYFKQGISNHREDLKDYMERFDAIRIEINNSSKDELLTKIHKLEEKAQERKKMHEEFRGSVFIHRLNMGVITNRLNIYKELYAVKSRCQEVESIDYYLEHPEDLMELVGS